MSMVHTTSRVSVFVYLCIFRVTSGVVVMHIGGWPPIWVLKCHEFLILEVLRYQCSAKLVCFSIFYYTQLLILSSLMNIICEWKSVFWLTLGNSISNLPSYFILIVHDTKIAKISDPFYMSDTSIIVGGAMPALFWMLQRR